MYVSLAAVISTVEPLELVLSGVWMFAIVLVWDVLVAVALGSRRTLGWMGRVLPWLTKIAGGFLVLFGATMIVGLVVRLVR